MIGLLFLALQPSTQMQSDLLVRAVAEVRAQAEDELYRDGGYHGEWQGSVLALQRLETWAARFELDSGQREMARRDYQQLQVAYQQARERVEEHPKLQKSFARVTALVDRLSDGRD